MKAKLKLSDTLQIEAVELYKDDKFFRNADLNNDIKNMIESVEIDLTAYLNMKYLADKNKNFAELVKVMDLKMIV